MKDLLLYILRSIVDYPDEVKVADETREDGFVVLTVSVNQGDMGKVIGRDGKIIKAIRSIIRVVAIRENKKVSVELEDQKGDSAVTADEDAE
jgi:uncharacterized protein